MNTNKEPNEETKELSPEIVVPADKVTIINVDEIKNNSVLIIKANLPSPTHKAAASSVFQKLLYPYIPILREKKVTVMIMDLKEDISIVPEEEMNAAGWEKKDKSVIINPFTSQ